MKIENPKSGNKLLTHPVISSLIDRRKTPRIPLRLPTEYFLGGTVKARLCHTINISEGGVLLCLPEKLDIGDKLKIEVYYYFDYELATFQALAEVLWIKNSKDSMDEYICALEFLDLSLPDLEKLKNFLRKIFY